MLKGALPGLDYPGLFYVMCLSRRSQDPMFNEAKILHSCAAKILQPCADEATVVDTCTHIHGSNPRHQRIRASVHQSAPFAPEVGRSPSGVKPLGGHRRFAADNAGVGNKAGPHTAHQIG